MSGIIFGQLVIGFFADRIGRKRGSIITASTMLICERGRGLALLCVRCYDLPMTICTCPHARASTHAFQLQMMSYPRSRHPDHGV